VLVKAGGVSPNFHISNSSDTFTSAPAVTIVGGSGFGATAHAVIAGGALVQIVLDNPGTGYLPGDQISVLVDGGGGTAVATTVPWPRLRATSIAVFKGRVWTSFRRTLSYTGTNGFDDVDPANAAGFFAIADADLVHEIMCLRSLNNFLYIFGDQSVKQIGDIAVQQVQGGSPLTQFNILTLASDIGCVFPMSVLSYNRYTIFANKQGIYAAMGATVLKISDELDGIFRRLDFAQELSAALFDLNNIHCYSVLGVYQDPDNIQVFGVPPQAGVHQRSIIMVLTFSGFQSNKAWWLMNQGMDLMAIMSLPMLATFNVQMFGSSGSDVTWLVSDPDTAVTWILKTPLSAHGNLIKAKHGIKAGVAMSGSEPERFIMSVDTENKSNEYTLYAAGSIIWRNKQHDIVAFAVPANNTGMLPSAAGVSGQPRLALGNTATMGVVNFITGPGFKLPYSSVDAYGRVIGASIFATSKNMAVNAVMIEYLEADDWGLMP
jgi:hypothetical protein